MKEEVERDWEGGGRDQGGREPRPGAVAAATFASVRQSASQSVVPSSKRYILKKSNPKCNGDSFIKYLIK